MKKTFQLQVEGKNPDRVLESLTHEVRKYVKRERARDLPKGVDFWDFDCRFGVSPEAAMPVHLNDITSLMQATAKEAGVQCYVEIVAKHGVRTPRPVIQPDSN